MEAQKKTNFNVQVDSVVCDQFRGLAKFERREFNELLEEAMIEKIEKAKRRGK